VDADIVMIGAGALGLSTALHCAMSGRSVAVIERHTEFELDDTGAVARLVAQPLGIFLPKR
jgi:glycine/D-amino acid oxidase-like deaminating enzyme